MAPEEEGGPAGAGPPAFPGGDAAPPPAPMPPAPPPPPPMPPPPPVSGPPSYPSGPGYQSGFPPPSGFATPGGMPYAQWGTRLGGYLIDAVIFIPVLVVLFILFRNAHALQVHVMIHRNGTQQRHFSLLSVILTGVLFIVYATVLCGGPRGQTIGMMAVGVRAVRDRTGEVVGYGRALGRSTLEQVLRALLATSLILGVVWILDMLWPLWDSKNQTLHDKAAGTVVIRTRNTG